MTMASLTPRATEANEEIRAVGAVVERVLLVEGILFASDRRRARPLFVDANRRPITTRMPVPTTMEIPGETEARNGSGAGESGGRGKSPMKLHLFPKC
jgi:hypothetical protein